MISPSSEGRRRSNIDSSSNNNNNNNNNSSSNKNDSVSQSKSLRTTTTTSSSNSSNSTSSITCLRILFLGLSVVCLMQLSYQYGGGIGSGVGGGSIFGCTTIFYVGNENENENENNDPTNNNSGKGGRKKMNLRQQVIDPDVPLTSYIKKKKEKVTTTDTHTDTETEMEDTLISDIPKFVVDPLFQHEQERIDHGMTPEVRCQQFGVAALPLEKQHTRRLFFGSMLANENSEVLIAHAIEVYNKYDVIALVESNTTHFHTPRAMNYPPNSYAARTLLDSDLFGSATNTKLYIDYWLEDEPLLTHMHREQEQRNTIWKRWVAAGMVCCVYCVVVVVVVVAVVVMRVCDCVLCVCIMLCSMLCLCVVCCDMCVYVLCCVCVPCFFLLRMQV